MNKELGRKITSLTLMTIMLTWSGAMGFSSTFMPEAFAENTHLYVSAEAEGAVARAQVIEIVVSEAGISELDQAYGMPDVSVNGSSILMAQAVDGAWYAYITDADYSNSIDSNYLHTYAGTSSGGDYGILCGPTTELAYKNDGASETGLSASETQGLWIPHLLGSTVGDDLGAEGTTAYSAGDSVTDCTPTAAENTEGVSGNTNSTANRIMNVVREPPALSNGTAANEYGNIKLGANMWPFIQILDFTVDGNIDIVYNRAGADEVVSLAYTDGADGISFDKPSYGLKHEIGMTLTDWNLNIDPTDEDSWTFTTLPTNASAYYQLFDENGANDASTSSGQLATVGQSGGNAVAWTSATIGDIAPAGVLTLDRNGDTVTSDATTNAVISFQDNADTTCVEVSNGLCSTADLNAADQPVTFTEAGTNTGVFINWDEALKTNMIIDVDAPRGTQAVLTYDQGKYGVMNQPQFATIEYDTDMVGGEWNSGEVVKITLVDPDMNLDQRTEDEMKVYSNATIVPAIKIGSPITLATLTALYQTDFSGATVLVDDALEQQCTSAYNGTTARAYESCYEKYSERSIITVANDPAAFAVGDGLEFRFSDDTTVKTLTDLISNANGTGAYTYVQYDFRGLNGGSDNLSFKGNFTFGDQEAGSAGADGDFLDIMYYVADGTNDSGPEASVGAGYFEGLVGNALVNGPALSTKLLGSTVLDSSDALIIKVTFGGVDTSVNKAVGDVMPLALDVVTWGQSNDGVNSSDRHNNAIYRLEVEEAENGNDSGIFRATVEYIMLNQLNVNNTNTYNSTVVNGDEIEMIVHNDSTDEDEIRVSYLDLGADGVETQISDQLAAPTHSGVVEFDSDSYKEADTVTVTLTDADLNTSPELINIYTVVSATNDVAYDMVGSSGYGSNSESAAFGRMLDITIDDELWLDSDVGSTVCSSDLDDGVVDGLYNSGFSLIETGINSGVFTGDFQIPSQYGARNSGSCAVTSTLGKDLEVNYVDYRDASGEIIEVGDGAGIRANTGSVSLDRTVYPVPFGQISDFSTESSKKTPNNRSIFPIHSTGISGSYLDTAPETLGNGDLTIHIRVDDPDYDVSATGEDQIAENTTKSNKHGPLKIYVSRGSEAVVLATAGGTTAQDGVITATTTVVTGGSETGTRQLGPISETAPDSGVFELDMTVRYTDGPDSADCPSNTESYTATDGSSSTGSSNRFASTASDQYHCILQGDVITVEYSDQNDASGNSGVAYDSATFDMRNGVLQTDKSVYIIGSDIIMTLIEPDLDLESDEAETWDLDLIEWDSDAATAAMGNYGAAGTSYASSFDPEPSDFRETGDSTGIFQIVIEVPASLGGTALDRGELIDLEYTDYSPSGAKYVGEENQDIGLSIYTSNFGATIELDQKVYTWTDKVYLTIVAPDHNFDSGLVDKIGDTDDDPLIVQTRAQKLTGYTLAETGTDTGIFSGEVILKGFNYDADGDSSTGDSSGYDVTSISSASGSGPTDGTIKADDDDGLTVSYEFNEDEVVVGSALIRWNIGEAQWLESSYPAGSSGVIRVIDPDMNWDPENVDNFDVDVWSSSDQGGVSVTISETNEATGIFEGTVTFTVDDESSGHRLRVAEGDTITVEYDDNTLPGPDYTSGDSLSITGTSIIGTVVPPLERAPAANARVVDSFGNSLSEVSVDQQVQIEADLVNGQDKDQSFAYLVQVQDANGVTVSLAWITGQLAAGQSFSPALSWIPSSSGTYEATVFVWESVDNPTALSDTVSASIRVV